MSLLFTVITHWLTDDHCSGEVDWERLYRKEVWRGSITSELTSLIFMTQIPAPYVPRVEGDGDSSCFEEYAEIDVAAEYGQTGQPDPHGHLFALF